MAFLIDLALAINDTDLERNSSLNYLVILNVIYLENNQKKYHSIAKGWDLMSF